MNTSIHKHTLKIHQIAFFSNFPKGEHSMLSATHKKAWIHSMKRGVLVQIFKGGDKCCLANYYLISLTPILMKIFERNVRREMILVFTPNLLTKLLLLLIFLKNNKLKLWKSFSYYYYYYYVRSGWLSCLRRDTSCFEPSRSIFIRVQFPVKVKLWRSWFSTMK